MASQVRSITTALLILEYLFGGLVRISPIPSPSLHESTYRKAVRMAPHLSSACFFPFGQDARKQMRFTGALMVFTGGLLAVPATRATALTLGLELFLTGAGIYSQSRAGLPFWLPCVNFALAWVVWGLGST